MIFHLYQKNLVWWQFLHPHTYTILSHLKKIFLCLFADSIFTWVLWLILLECIFSLIFWRSRGRSPSETFLWFSNYFCFFSKNFFEIFHFSDAEGTVENFSWFFDVWKNRGRGGSNEKNSWCNFLTTPNGCRSLNFHDFSFYFFSKYILTWWCLLCWKYIFESFHFTVLFVIFYFCRKNRETTEDTSFQNQFSWKNWCHFSAHRIKISGGNSKTKTDSAQLTFPCGIVWLSHKSNFGRKLELKNWRELFFTRKVNSVLSVFVFHFCRETLMQGTLFLVKKLFS